jgi:hypothetical protein
MWSKLFGHFDPEGNFLDLNVVRKYRIRGKNGTRRILYNFIQNAIASSHHGKHAGSSKLG